MVRHLWRVFKRDKCVTSLSPYSLACLDVKHCELPHPVATPVVVLRHSPVGQRAHALKRCTRTPVLAGWWRRSTSSTPRWGGTRLWRCR